MTDLYAHLQERVLNTVGGGLPPSDQTLPLQPPKNRAHGDVAFGCFLLAKALGRPPADIARSIAQAVEADQFLESVEATGPFVNVRFRRAALARNVIEGVLDGDPPYGRAAPTGENIVVDFSSPNIAKPFHMGHLRSTVIGAALCRIHRHLGHAVHGINHLGDWGAQFGKMITAFQRWGSMAELRRDPMRHMFEVYVRYGRESAADPTLDEESAEHFRKLESGEDNEERQLWGQLRELSLKAFNTTYRRLGVEFDHITGESFYEDKIDAALDRLRKAGVTTFSEGAEVVELDQGMPPCILRKSDGTTIYATRDLAAVFYRLATFHFDRALYVVGAEQKLHFRQLRAVLVKMGMAEAERIEHVGFGLVLAENPDTKKWEKFATRGGRAIFLEDVLDEAVAQVRRIIEEKNPDIEDMDSVAEEVGVSAIIFNDLKNSRIKDVKFDWSSMLNFDGETGPYVQYAVARLSGILRRSGEEDIDPREIDFELLADADTVLLSMLDFGAALQRASEQNEPSIITNLVIQIASSIHSYLRDHNVIRAEPDLKRARLVLVRAARELLRTGLGLLGVTAPDRM